MCFRSRLVIEEDSDQRLIVHHFKRDPVGAAFGTLWLCGWMGGIILVAHGTPWPWPGYDLRLMAAMLGVWLLCAVAVVNALVQRSRLTVTADSVTYDEWMLVHVRRKSIPAAEVVEISIERRNRRGGPYDVIVITGRRKTVLFADGIDRQVLLDCMHHIQRRAATTMETPRS